MQDDNNKSTPYRQADSTPKKNMPWTKFYPADFLAATYGMTGSEFRVFTVVMALVPDHGGWFKRDDARLAKRCNLATPTAKSATEKLLASGDLLADGPFIQTRLHQDDTAKRRKKTHDIATTTATVSQIGGEKISNSKDARENMPHTADGFSQQKQDPNGPNTPPRARAADAEAEADAETDLGNADAFPPDNGQKNDKYGRPFLSEKWTLPPDWLASAQKNYVATEAQILDHAERFKDYQLSSPNGQTNMRAAWNWYLLNVSGLERVRPGSTYPPPPPDPEPEPEIPF